MRIMVVEDDADIRALISQSLSQAGYRVSTCGDAESAIRDFATFEPDCLIVDWMLPDMSGIEFVRWLRRQQTAEAVPVLMLTARSEEFDKIKGLEAGADDYMTKPMSLREMNARIKALLRRPGHYHEAPHLLEVEGLTINTRSKEAIFKTEQIELTKTEFNLLQYFVENPDKVLDRNQILNGVWGVNSFLDDRTVDVHILRLRKVLKRYKLEHLILTVRGTGYRFSRQRRDVITPNK
ncbi:MAG: two-component system phosphate regulon response regulator PhoB [Gammaproteobacteria bacterium]|jgi:two-component system phosphate regulon response regulator PhoB